jgi:hypothetical protein
LFTKVVFDVVFELDWLVNVVDELEVKGELEVLVSFVDWNLFAFKVELVVFVESIIFW